MWNGDQTVSASFNFLSFFFFLRADIREEAEFQSIQYEETTETTLYVATTTAAHRLDTCAPN
jgi:hypothetical protein